MKYKADSYQEWLDQFSDMLCGVSCGAAVDIIVNYVKRPDCSTAQLRRLIKELTEYETSLHSKEPDIIIT